MDPPKKFIIGMLISLGAVIVILILTIPLLFPTYHFEGTITKKFNGPLSGRCFELDNTTTINIGEADYNKYKIGDYFNGTGWPL
jgi:hypothetical protein